MKKMIFGLALLAGACAFAGIDNVVVTFSTKGPDKYADGEKVVDGEVYALVWVANDAENGFAGLDANGDLLDKDHNKILLKAPVAKDFHCPNIQFEIDADYYQSAGLKNGQLFVYLMDTRRFQMDDNGIVKDADEHPIVASVGDTSKLVNGYGAATDAIICDQFAAANLSKSAEAGVTAAVPEKGKQLKIKDIKLVEGNVWIYVSGSLQSMRYGVKMGKMPNELNKKNVKELYGSGNDDLIIITPQKEDSAFFSVESLSVESL